MRRELLALLRCPVTGEGLVLEDAADGANGEVLGGVLVTLSGGRRYPIVDGVPELLPPLDPATQRERDAREGWQAEDPAALRACPYVHDPRAPWKWPGRAANAEQGIALLPTDGARVLDIGAATGWSTRMIAARGARAVALDISTDRLIQAQAQFETGVYFDRVAGTMSALPFVDGSFEAVFASAAVHHGDDLRAAFREMSRVLKAGGAAVLTSEPVLGVFRAGAAFGQEAKAEGMNEHIYRLGDYLRAAREAGLRPRVLFPADLAGQLAGTLPPPSALMGRVRPFWRALLPALRGLALFPAHHLIGLSLTLVARKHA